MPDLLIAVLATPGIWFVAGAALVAGLVRGFSGFGTAMVFLPVAAMFIDPVPALLTLTMMDIFGPIPVLPRAWREADRPDLFRLLIGAAVMLPIGLWVLLSVDPDVFRYSVSVGSLILLACLVLGLRYSGTLRPASVTALGGAGGFLGGIAGLPGPPVILAYMAGPKSPSKIRANTMLYLYGFDVFLLVALAAYGRLEAHWLLFGLCMAVPYGIGALAGTRLFQPGRERLYRGAAYVIIGISAVSGLPFWNGG